MASEGVHACKHAQAEVGGRRAEKSNAAAGVKER